MAKTEYLKVRLAPEESRNLEFQARALNLPKSRLARLLLTGGAMQKPEQSPSAPPAKIDETRLVAIEAELAEMRDSAHQSAAAFNSLLSKLDEILRVPSFREYRGRLAAEGIEKKQNETDEQYLVRCANRYFIAYSVWPDPADSRRFGPVPAGVDFPKTPPAR